MTKIKFMIILYYLLLSFITNLHKSRNDTSSDSCFYLTRNYIFLIFTIIHLDKYSKNFLLNLLSVFYKNIFLTFCKY